MVVEMDSSEPKPGNWKRMRWVWLALAIWGLLATPGALIDAFNFYRTEHRLGWIIPLAFALRFGQIWLFAWLWWRCPPANADAQSPML
jgi:hypothetical protein